MKNLNEELGNMTEWARAVVFDQNLKVLAKKNVETNETELRFPYKQFHQELQRQRNNHRTRLHSRRGAFRSPPISSSFDLRTKKRPRKIGRHFSGSGLIKRGKTKAGSKPTCSLPMTCRSCPRGRFLSRWNSSTLIVA